MNGKRHVSFDYPERYFDQDEQAFRYRQKRYETWWENGQKMGRWEWVPAIWNGNWIELPTTKETAE
jgi:hypothetical protein